jgi:hypothetical protein
MTSNEIDELAPAHSTWTSPVKRKAALPDDVIELDSDSDSEQYIRINCTYFL